MRGASRRERGLEAAATLALLLWPGGFMQNSDHHDGSALPSRALACSLALSFAALGLLAGACSSSPEDGPTTEDGGTTPTEGGDGDAHDGGSSPPGELQIVSLTSTKSTITGGTPNANEAASATFIAVVTDVHGLDAISGGELIDDGDGVYATFRAEATKGTYAATVDFAMLDRVRPIEFRGANGQRTFKAKFSDRAGNVAIASLGLALACRDELSGLIGACAGACVDVDRHGANCGTCGQKCGAGKICRAGKCRSATVAGNVSECIALSAAGPGTTCNAICIEASTGGCDQDGLYSFRKDDPQCTQPPAGVGACSQRVEDPFFACLCRPRL